MRVTKEQLQTIFELGSEMHLRGKLTACNMTTAEIAKASRRPVDDILVTITDSLGDISEWCIEANGDAAPVTRGRK